MLHPRSFAPVPSLAPKRKGKKEAAPRGSCFCRSKYPGAGLVVLIGDSGAWYNVGNIRQRLEFSSRHTKVIVINSGVPFRVVLNLVTFCILSSFRAVFTWLSKGIGFGFGFGFTTPFGWLVYSLWFWFYDSQVKTALIEVFHKHVTRARSWTYMQ